MRSPAVALFVVTVMVEAGSAVRLSAQQEIALGTVEGVVVDVSREAPVPHAFVELRPTYDPVRFRAGVTIRADAAGRFRASVASGRYAIFVRAAGYVDAPAWHQHSTQAQRWVTVPVDETVTGLRLTVTRGASVSGVVRGPEGQPLANVAVSVGRWGSAEGTGERVLLGLQGGETDVDGRFRLWGLPPGEYLLSTSGENPFRPGLQFIPGPNQPVVETIAHADVQLVRAGVLPARPLTASTIAVPPAPVSASSAGSTEIAATFYPGVTNPAHATPIVLGPGEEQRGLEFQVRRVPVATVSGTVAESGGSAQPSVQILSAGGAGPLSPWARNQRDGSGEFRFSGVPPGVYSVVAHVLVPAADVTQAPAVWTDAVEVVVNGSDVQGVLLSPKPGALVTGRLSWTGPSSDEANRRVYLQLMPVLSGTPKAGVSPAEIGADGSLRWKDVAAGRYTVALPSGESATRLALASVFLDGRDVTGEPLDVASNGLDGLVVTLTDRAPSLSGLLRTASGARASGWVIVFATDAKYWRPHSGRVAGVFAGAGEYAFSRLPPGEYWIATVPDLQPREWFDPRFLESLRAGAERITLRDGDTPRLDLRAR